MHELTLLFGVAEQVGKVAEENNIEHIDAVVLEIGELTAVVPEFMMDGYPVISDEYDFLRGSELIIDTIAAIGHCNECGNEFALDDWHLAKRQLTWFKRNKNINWMPLNEAKDWLINLYLC